MARTIWSACYSSNYKRVICNYYLNLADCYVDTCNKCDNLSVLPYMCLVSLVILGILRQRRRTSDLSLIFNIHLYYSNGRCLEQNFKSLWVRVNNVWYKIVWKFVFISITYLWQLGLTVDSTHVYTIASSLCFCMLKQNKELAIFIIYKANYLFCFQRILIQWSVSCLTVAFFPAIPTGTRELNFNLV